MGVLIMEASVGLSRELREAIETGDLGLVRHTCKQSDLGWDEVDGTALHYTAYFGTREIAEFFVDLGIDINRRGGTYDAPALTYAAEQGNVNVVKYLLLLGADIDISHVLRNPLTRAAEEGHVDVVKLLLDAGVNPLATYRIPTGKLINALSIAEDNGHQDVANILRSRGCKRPVEGVDVPIWEPSKSVMMEQIANITSSGQIIDYIQLRFGPVDELGLQELLPVVDGLSVTINVIRPNEYHPYLVLFTNGMSDLPMNVPAGQEDWRFAELVIHLPADWPHPRDVGQDSPWLWPVQWLRKMAYYPHLNKTWLGRPAAIVSSDEPPKPLGANTDQTCLLMVPDFANLGDPLQRGDGTKVHFFTVVPLHTAERDYELKNGMKAFFEQFIEHKVPMTVDVNRESFC
jgi:hypothetical protein